MNDLPCAVCESAESVGVWQLHRDPHLANLALDARAFRKVMCRGCGLVYSRPQLEPDELTKLYAGFRSSDTPAPGHLAAKQQLAADDFGWLAPRLPAPGDALDIGCSEGSFLHLLKGAGWRTVGIEPSAFAVFARRHYGLDVRQSLFEAAELPPASFDLVVALRVLEHVADARDFLARVARLLRPGGMLYVETPNAWNPRHRLGEFLGAQHLRLFTRSSLAWLFKDCGYTIVVLDARGRGLRALIRADPGAPISRSDRSNDRPDWIDPLKLRVIYARHGMKYLWKTRGRVALVSGARRTLGAGPLRALGRMIRGKGA